MPPAAKHAQRFVSPVGRAACADRSVTQVRLERAAQAGCCSASIKLLIAATERKFAGVMPAFRNHDVKLGLYGENEVHHVHGCETGVTQVIGRLDCSADGALREQSLYDRNDPLCG